MTEWRLFANSRCNVDNGGEAFLALLGAGGGSGYSNSTEALVQQKIYEGYGVSNLWVEVANHSGEPCAFDFSGDGVRVPSFGISISGSGWLEDVSATGVMDADELVNYDADQTAGMHGDNITIDAVAITFDHATVDAPIVGGAGSSGGNPSILFAGFATCGSMITPESEAETRFQRDQTLDRLSVNCWLDNSMTSTVALRKDGVTSTNLTMSVSSGTGQYEDVTGSDSYTDGEDGAFMWDFDGGSGGIHWSCTMDTAETFLGTQSSGEIATTRKYPHLDGGVAITTVEDEWLARIGSVTAGNLRVQIEDAGSGTRDWTFRVGSTDSSNLTISITTSGVLEDNVGSESVADADHVSMSCASTGSSIRWNNSSIELPWSAAGPAPTKRPEGIAPIVQHRPRSLIAKW